MSIEATPNPSVGTESSLSGREANGRFVDGNPGGHGNPFARAVAALRCAVVECVTREDVVDVARAMLSKAKKGDVPAARLLFAYLLGKPAAAVEPDRLDLGEFDVFKAEAGMMREVPGMVAMPPAEMPLKILRTTRPAMAQETGKRMAKGLARDARRAARKAARRAARRAQAEAEGRAGPSPNGSNGEPPFNGSELAPSPIGSNGDDAPNLDLATLLDGVEAALALVKESQSREPALADV